MTNDKTESDRQSAPPPNDHYQSIVDHAHREIEGVRSVYQWLAGCIGIIFATFLAAATFLTYSNIRDIRNDMRAESDLIKARVTQETGLLSQKLALDLEKTVADVNTQIRQRVDDEFKKENIEELVRQKAQERIDEIADVIIAKKIQATIQPVLEETTNNLAQLKSEAAKSQATLRDIENASTFSMTALAAQNDDRKAFDQLRSWSTNETFAFAKQASAAWFQILDGYARISVWNPVAYPWPKHIDPSAIALPELKQIYATTPAAFKNCMIKYIWERADISKHDKMAFMVDVIESDESLRAVCYAAQRFSEASGTPFPTMSFVTPLLDWWKTNREAMK